MECANTSREIKGTLVQNTTKDWRISKEKGQSLLPHMNSVDNARPMSMNGVNRMRLIDTDRLGGIL